MSDPLFRVLAEDAAARYKPAGRFAYHFALRKLTWDPAFAHILAHGLIRRGSRILDLGCGQGLLAVLLETARDRYDASPGSVPPPPDPVAYLGIDVRMRDIERAKHAVDGTARFVCGDIRSEPFDAADAVVILDVLHYLDYGAQDALLRRARAALDGGGTLLLRVADGSPTLRFRYTVAMDRIVTIVRSHRIDRFHCRPLGNWIRTLEALGFDVTAAPMSAGLPFANVLLVARYDPSGKNEASPALCLHNDELPRPRPRADARSLPGDVERARSLRLRDRRSGHVRRRDRGPR